MDLPKVVLIGGSPGAGKTTLGRAVAAESNRTSLSVDDLFTAAKAVTTPVSHPGLHTMSTRAADYVTYFTEGPVEALIEDAVQQHQATWPAVAQVIRNHAQWGSPIVIDGWALRPEWVHQLDLPASGVASFWIHIDPEVLEARERENDGFFGRSSDRERMFRHFLKRSLWHNEQIRESAIRLGLPVLVQDGTRTVGDLVSQVIETTE